MFKVKMWDRVTGEKFEREHKNKISATRGFNKAVRGFSAIGRDMQIIQELHGETVRKAVWGNGGFNVFQYPGWAD